jgi:hypothetical protein
MEGGASCGASARHLRRLKPAQTTCAALIMSAVQTLNQRERVSPEGTARLWLKSRLSNSFGYHARAPSRSALIAQDAQALEAIRVRDQPDDLKQHIPLETGGKASGEFLKTAGLIADRLPSKPQDPLARGHRASWRFRARGWTFR